MFKVIAFQAGGFAQVQPIKLISSIELVQFFYDRFITNKDYHSQVWHFTNSIDMRNEDNSGLFFPDKDELWMGRICEVMDYGLVVGKLKFKQNPDDEANAKSVFFKRLYLALEEYRGVTFSPLILPSRLPDLPGDSLRIYRTVLAKLLYLSRFYLEVSSGLIPGPNMHRARFQDSCSADIHAKKVILPSFTYEQLMGDMYYARLLGLSSLDPVPAYNFSEEHRQRFVANIPAGSGALVTS